MADIAEFHLLKPGTFSDGTDTYKGVKQIRGRKNPRPTVASILEGDLEPTRLEEVESTTPPWSGQVLLAGPNANALIGTTIASATMIIRDITHASNTKTLTITNMLIKGVGFGANRTSLEDAVYDWEATNVAIADTA
jgi:hypothetical protein